MALQSNKSFIDRLPEKMTGIQKIGKTDRRFDSFADADAVGKLIIVKRAIQSYCALILFLMLPTMWLKKNYIFFLARFPVFRKFEYFCSMLQIISDNNDKKRKR